MNEEDLLAMSISHEIDMDILRQLEVLVDVDHTKEIEIAEKRFKNKVDRLINGMTNKTIHGVDIRIPTDGSSLRSRESQPFFLKNKLFII
jgi:hypothetical protein